MVPMPITHRVITGNTTKTKALALKKFLAIGVITIAICVLLKGVDLVHYETLRSQADGISGNVGSRKCTPELEIKINLLEKLKFVGGISAWVREMLAGILDPACHSSARVEASIRDVLKAEPTSGRGWLELAKQRRKQSGTSELLYPLLQMSQVSEPREIKVMAARTIFGLSIWKDLPKTRQRQVVGELSATVPFMDQKDAEEIKEILRSKTGFEKTAIKEMLDQAGELPWRKALGL
jgi:hypothetical protein